MGRHTDIGTVYHITITSWWGRWRLESPALRWFVQQFVQAQIKDNIKVPRHWPLRGNSPATGEFSSQMASDVENVSIWWRHHAKHQYARKILDIIDAGIDGRLFLMVTSSNGYIFRVTAPLSPVNSPHKGQWCGARIFSLTCAWIDDWVNNRETGDLRRYRAHHDVTIMGPGLAKTALMNEKICLCQPVSGSITNVI